MSDLEKAISIAVTAHNGQYDKAGEPYVLHPLRLMFKFQDKNEMIVAVLHDVIEDSQVSLDDLKDHGFSKIIIDAVECLSRHINESYEDFIVRVYGNPLAKKVKVEDIKDNLSVYRLREITKKDLVRIEKYHDALRFLLG
ncbi:MAG: GTP pyrophosphokinase [Cellvibrionaceae bacterium]